MPAHDHRPHPTGERRIAPRGTSSAGRSLLAALVGCMTLVPALLAVDPGRRIAAAYPDNAAQPVNFGDAGNFGPAGGPDAERPAGRHGRRPTTEQGYWIVASDGGIFNYGNAPFCGSAGAIPLNKPIVGMAATPDGGGYWLVASDGGIFSYGDAHLLRLDRVDPPQPAHRRHGRHPDGHGYWLVASDGGIFAYGDAQFYGSTGSIHLNQPVVGMAAGPGGNGYWLVASDGGIFAYGIGAVPRLDGRHHAQRPDCGDGRHGERVLAGRQGRRRLQLRHGTVPRLHGRPGRTPTRSAPLRSRPRDRATGSCRRARRRCRPPSSSARPDRRWPPCSRSSTPSATGSTPRAASFDDSTQQAVWALQKAANLPRDGVVGPATWAALGGRGRAPAAAGVGLPDPDQPRERPDHGRQQQPPAVDAQHVDRRRLHRTRRTAPPTWPSRPTGDVQHLPRRRRDRDRLARHPVPAAILLPGLRHPR